MKVETGPLNRRPNHKGSKVYEVKEADTSPKSRVSIRQTQKSNGEYNYGKHSPNLYPITAFSKGHQEGKH